MGYRSILSDLREGIPCRFVVQGLAPLRFDHEFELKSTARYPLQTNTVIGLVLVRDGWPIHVRAALALATTEQERQQLAVSLRDTTVMYFLAYTAQVDPNLLPFLPALPRSLACPIRDPQII